MQQRANNKVWYRIVSTYNSDNWKKSCELTETVHMSYNRIMAKVNRYYNVGYDDYGKAEAVELEMLTPDQIEEWEDYNDEN